MIHKVRLFWNDPTINLNSYCVLCLYYWSNHSSILYIFFVTEELLGGNKTITSSQDSLLEPSESFKCRPVQRATSEPSQKFEQLRELKVRQQHVPIMMSRATSDDTVRTSHKLADHIYENINEVRNRLMVASQSKPSKLSARARPSYSFSTKPTPDYNQNKLQVQSQGALNHSMGQLNQLTNMHAQPGFRSQYNIVSAIPE